MKQLLSRLFFVFICAQVCLAEESVIIKSDMLQWHQVSDLPGAKVAIISGDPEKKEPFIARVKLPANFKIPVHAHTINEYDTVISGAWYLGIGSKFDIEHMQKISVNGFVMIPAKLQHYAWNKEETILQINGMGPWGMVYQKTYSQRPRLVI